MSDAASLNETHAQAGDSGVRVLLNPLRAPFPDDQPPDRAPLAFHHYLPGYAPTPLTDAPAIARALGVGRVWVKDESERLGLPAFKILGASWATYRAVERHVGGFGAWESVADLRAHLAPALPLTLVAATDGNHGRAVARMAALLGLSARIFVPNEMVPARRAAIAAERAEVVVVDGTYDDAVTRAAEAANGRCLVIADTAWEGYTDIPHWVIEGYSTMLWEVDDELTRRGEPGPGVVVAQIGVGAFAAAVTRHYRTLHRATHRPDTAPAPHLIGVEPLTAACLMASVAAGEIVAVPGPHPSIMAGLNCGTPSLVAWPVVSRGMDTFVAVGDDWTRQAMRLLARAGIVAGETGAAGLAGLLALRHLLPDSTWQSRLGLHENATVLLFNCEGATDSEAYARVVGA